ncbi:hypothetical protein RIF29_28827 [Crotalaria pallida]|uniref:Uncharacterized protein n=1 Tax=Crotalaria pallida TaxID=3830 RepID=A0AAN9EDV4_CROPI
MEWGEFRQFINDLELVDLPLIGRKYTRYKPNGKASSKLDRFLINEEWNQNWNDIKQVALQQELSDRCPLLLNCDAKDWVPKPCRTNNCWLEDHRFEQFVKTELNKISVQGWEAFILKEKLKLLKHVLKEWNKTVFGDLDKKIEDAVQKINHFDSLMEERDLQDQEDGSRFPQQRKVA